MTEKLYKLFIINAKKNEYIQKYSFYIYSNLDVYKTKNV